MPGRSSTFQSTEVQRNTASDPRFKPLINTEQAFKFTDMAIDVEASSRHSTVTDSKTDHRHKVVVCEGQKKELEFLTKGMNLQKEKAPSLSDGITRSQNNSSCLQVHEHIILDDAHLVKEVVLNERTELSRIEQTQRKSHWNFVLEEMEWMANDFMQERIWKMNVAARISCLVDFARRQSDFQEQIQETTMATQVCFQAPQGKRKLEFQESLYYTVPSGAMEAYRNSTFQDHKHMLQGDTDAFVGSSLVSTEMSRVRDILHVQFIPKRSRSSTIEVGRHIVYHSDAGVRNPPGNIQSPLVTRNRFLNCGLVDVDLIPKRPRSSAVSARQHVAGLHVISQHLQASFSDHLFMKTLGLC